MEPHSTVRFVFRALRRGLDVAWDGGTFLRGGVAVGFHAGATFLAGFGALVVFDNQSLDRAWPWLVLVSPIWLVACLPAGLAGVGAFRAALPEPLRQVGPRDTAWWRLALGLWYPLIGGVLVLAAVSTHLYREFGLDWAVAVPLATMAYGAACGMLYGVVPPLGGWPPRPPGGHAELTTLPVPRPARLILGGLAGAAIALTMPMAAGPAVWTRQPLVAFLVGIPYCLLVGGWIVGTTVWLAERHRTPLAQAVSGSSDMTA